MRFNEVMPKNPDNPDNPDSSGNIHPAPVSDRKVFGRRPFLEGLITKAGSVALTSGLRPLATLSETAGGGGLASRSLSGIGLNFLSEESQLRLQELVAPLEQAKTPEQQEAQLLEISKEFLVRYKNCESNGNFVLDEVVNARPNYNTQFNEVVKDQRRLAARLIEDGVALLSTWGALKGDFQAGFKDKTSKLNFAGRTLAVNGSVRDFHLALNLIKARLGFLSETGLLQKDLFREDYEDMMAFLDIDPAMDVKPDSWVIMPAEWMTNIARAIKFLDRNNIPPPMGIIIDPPEDPDDPDDKEKSKPKMAGFYQSVAESPFPERSQVLNFYSRRASKSSAGEIIYHELGHFVAEAIRIPERLIGPKPQQPDHQMQYDQIVGRGFLEYLFNLQAKGIKTLDGSALKMFVSEYALRGGSIEDFAEVFTKYCQLGPQFRFFLEELKKIPGLEGITEILEIKYNYIKDTVAGGEIFSFEQRQRRAEIQGWENTHPDLRTRQLDIADFHQLSARRQALGFPRIDNLREANLRASIPNDVEQLIALSQPRVWSDLLGLPTEDIKAISAPHPIVTFGLEGKLDLAMRTSQPGETRIALDTSRSYSLDYLETVFREGDIYITDLFDSGKRITAGTNDALKGLNLPDIKAMMAFIPKDDHFYLRFAKDSSSGEFRAQPLEIWSSTVHRTFVNKYQESLPGMERRTTMKSAEKDIILEISSGGEIVQVYHQGTSLGSKITSPVTNTKP